MNRDTALPHPSGPYPPTEAMLAEPVPEAPLSLLVPLWTLILANLFFGVNTNLSVGVARQAAVSLIGGG